MINVDILKQFRNGHFDRPKNNRKFFAYGDRFTGKEFLESGEPTLYSSRSFLNKIIECYWDIVCCRKKIDLPVRETPFSFSRLPNRESRLAIEIAGLVGNMDVVEAGYYISSIYARLIPPDRRSSLGVFYTPPAIVNRLIDNVTESGFDWKRGKILDPACGGGAFLAPLALRLLQESGKKDFFQAIEDIEIRLKGYEIDDFAAWMSMVFLDAALLDAYKVVKRRIKNIVEVRNTLTSAVEGQEFYDLIIGNPPYGKIFLQPHLRKFYSRSLYGHANLYGLFIDAALRLSNPGALIAFVTSTSYLGGKYFKSLRKLLMDEASPVLMDFFEERKGVFDEVLQETMITLFKKDLQGETGININTLRSNGKEASVAVEHIGRFFLSGREDEPWKIPREKMHLVLFEKIKDMKNRLRDLGYTAVTGQLVWNRHKDQLKHERGIDTFPLIWAESVLSDETFKFNFGQKNHTPYFKLKEKQEYLLTKDTCLLVQRTTAKEQRRRIVAAILPGSFLKKYKGVVVENHLNIIKPRVKETPVSLEALKYILNSRTLDMVFRSINGSVAVSAYEIESLPMPDPDQVQWIEKMIEERTSKEKIEEKLAEIYGINDVVT